MESNITKILIKKFWKRCVTLPLNSLQRGMTLSFLCSLLTDDPPFCGPSPSSLPPPPLPKKNVHSLRDIGFGTVVDFLY